MYRVKCTLCFGISLDLLRLNVISLINILGGRDYISIRLGSFIDPSCI